MTREQKIKQIERLRRKYQNAFRTKVKEALTVQYSSYITALKSNGAQYVLSHPVANLIDPALSATIQQLYTLTGIASATLEYRRLKRLPRIEKKKGTLGFNAQWTSDILAYFRLNLFNKVVLPISDTTQDYIQQVLTEGIAQGWSIDEMVEKITRQDYLDGRVERILRTEINRAINYGHELAGKTYEFKSMKRWVAVHDHRTRHPHLEADGQTVELDASFNVGGEVMDFPGDPEASAANTVNCRCHTEIVPLRNEAGRLIPRENSPVRVRGRLRAQIQEIIRDLSN